MKKRIIIHIDMNSYFAAVEQQANPFLRGRSVGVAAYNSPNGTIIASSMEAKERGIKTGCKVGDAKLLDPEVVILENEPAKYRTITEQIFSIFRTYTNVVEPYSIDEAFLDMTGWVKDWKEVEKICEKIQNRIKVEVGEWLSCSVGASWTKFLAKFASDIAPKKSILMIRDQKELEFKLKDCPLTEAWGINKRTEYKLKNLDIHNLLELRNYSSSRIRHFLGMYGYYLWANVNGLEISSVSEGSQESKSVGHSYCLPKKTKDKEYLRPILYKLCEKTGRRLRESGREAQGINIYMAYTREGGAGKSWKTSEKIFTTEDIFYYADLFIERTTLFFPVRMIAVSVFRLSEVTNQMSLFDDNLSIKELSKSVDRINDKYGEYTVVRGSMFGTKDVARDRIGFRKTIEI